MAKDSALVRQWTLLKTLSNRRWGVTVQEMAREFDVNEKTIRRDLETFIGVGLPIEEEVVDHGQKRWKISSGKQPDMSFRFDEALALYMGRRFLEPLAGTFLWDASQSAFAKIRACLGENALAYLEKMMGNLHYKLVGAGDYSKKANVIDQLMLGIEQRHATFIVYQSLNSTEPVTYEIFPYGLIYHRHSLYVAAFSRDHNELRTFKIDRMESAEVTRIPFQMPKDFDLEEHLSRAFGMFQGKGNVTVKIRFQASVARYVTESRWHDSQKLTLQRDGSVLAEFQLSETEEIKRWVYGFGPAAMVLAPESLRREMARELHAAYAHYASAADANKPKPKASATPAQPK